MTRETIKDLNANTLIFFTEKRGKAWHYREGADNHFEGAGSAELVKERLFNWEPVSTPVYIKYTNGEGEEVLHQVPNQQAITRSDNRHVMGIFKEGYQPHPYNEWLLNNVAVLLDEGLAIGSAGVLRQGAQAWVSVEVPETITTREGIQYRPNLLAVTSFDGSIATTYKRVVTNVVCDNTMAAGLAEEGQQFKAKHTKNSGMRILEARQALELVHVISEAFEAEVKRLTDVTVTDRQWGQFLEALAPTEGKEKRSLTIAINKQEKLRDMWATDLRVAPWSGTAFGVLQAVNTYTHHEGTVQNVGRAERNMSRAITGGIDNHDAEVISLLEGVLA